MTDARTFAATAHSGQKYGDSPYTAHLSEVVEIVRTQTASELAVTVAWLHDVVEDTSVSLMDIYHLFGPRVATAVMLLTDPEGENRKARKAGRIKKGDGKDVHHTAGNKTGRLENSKTKVISRSANRSAGAKARHRRRRRRG